MAYAAVISLKHTIQRLKNSINKPRITKSAYKELDSLQSMLKRWDEESSRNIDRSLMNEFDAKTRDAVWKLEDVLESYVLYKGLDLKGVEREMTSFLKKVQILTREYYRLLIQISFAAEKDEALSAAVPPVNQSTTVGLSDLSLRIRNELLDGGNELKIVSVLGMAGIGKTHLAAYIYHLPRIVQHFESRVWVRVGPKYQTENIIVDIAAQILGEPSYPVKKKIDDLYVSYLISRKLYDRRILIVLDDVWSSEAFFSVINLFPESENGSRVLMTTRIQLEATGDEYLNEYKSWSHNEMPFLNNEESWNLLWQNVFVAEKSFPPELEKPGRKIAENCEGLPLLILAVANILRGLDKTEEYWEKVAENKTTTFIDAYDQIYEVLLPSYEYLPQHLKACFLYMGVFSQRYQIPVSRLISLWAIEDFLEPSSHNWANEDHFLEPYSHSKWAIEDFLEPSWHSKLEESAMESMKGLVSKSIAIVCKWSFEKDRRMKSSKLHSVYWYMCVKEAEKNKLFHVLNKLTDVSKDYVEGHRRFSVQNNILFGLHEACDSMAAATLSATRSLLYTGEAHQYPVRICFINMMLLIRVLDALAIRFYEFPNEVLKLLQLRYLSLTHNGELPSSISNLQQLQCLILRRFHNIIKVLQSDSICLPEEIWDMKELRHLRIMGSNLRGPSKGEEIRKLLLLYVNAHSCTEAVFRSIPNLKKLGIRIELEPDAAAETIRCFEHIGLLTVLESVKCVVVNPRMRLQLGVAPPDHLSNLPRGLMKLSLNGLGYSWKYMSAIGSLPNLKVMKLRCSAFQGPHWETEVGQFERLEFLLLEDIDLVHWTAKYYRCFRRLQHLSVRHCYKLKNIPACQYLKMLEIDDCSPSFVDYVQQIKLKTKNSHLEVVTDSSWNLR